MGTLASKTIIQQIGIAAALLATAVANVNAATIRVPQDQSTVQGAVYAAANGDTILVDEGNFIECVIIDGKTLTINLANNEVQSAWFLTAQRNANLDPALTVRNGARVVLIKAGILGSAPANQAGNLAGGPAVEVFNSIVTFQQCQLRGGTAFPNPATAVGTGGVGLTVESHSIAWIHDSGVFGGNGSSNVNRTTNAPGEGGVAMVILPEGSFIRAFDSDLVAGFPGDRFPHPIAQTAGAHGADAVQATGPGSLLVTNSLVRGTNGQLLRNGGDCIQCNGGMRIGRLNNTYQPGAAGDSGQAGIELRLVGQNAEIPSATQLAGYLLGTQTLDQYPLMAIDANADDIIDAADLQRAALLDDTIIPPLN